MRCEDARKRWHRRWDDGVVDTPLDQHLDRCEACRRYGQEMSHVTSLLDQVRLDTDRIVSQRASGPTIPMRVTLRSSLRRWVKPVIGIAAAIALVATAPTYFKNEAPRSTDTPLVVSKSATPLGMTLQGDIAKHYVVVSKPVAQSNVQVFWLYPTLK